MIDNTNIIHQRKGCFVNSPFILRVVDEGYSISASKESGKVWIEHSSGEGFECDAQKLYELIDKFYKDEF